MSNLIQMKMKKGLIICLAFIGMQFLFSCGQNQTSQAQSKLKNDGVAASTIVYLSYNGTATDDGNITGKNTNEEFHLFMKNDTQVIVYVISKTNYDLWTKEKIIPKQLKPMIQTYKVDIASSKKLQSSDNTVEYYEITKLNSMVETDEINQ